MGLHIQLISNHLSSTISIIYEVRALNTQNKVCSRTIFIKKILKQKNNKPIYTASCAELQKSLVESPAR